MRATAAFLLILSLVAPLLASPAFLEKRQDDPNGAKPSLGAATPTDGATPTDDVTATDGLAPTDGATPTPTGAATTGNPTSTEDTAATVNAAPTGSPSATRAYASQFIITNSCPAPIRLFNGGTEEGTIPVGGSLTRFTLNGFFFTDAHGGSATGEGTLRAGFFDNGYYYMVKDGSKPLNTGMSITPQQRPSPQGFCTSISCNAPNCTTAFEQPPTRFPPPEPSPPAPPYYRCPNTNTTYMINFCPTGSWPGPQTHRIHPNFNHPEKCLDVRGAVFANGTPVQIYDCNGTPAQDWILDRGRTKVRLAGTNFCLDAGSNPANGVGMKIWQCYDNLPAQQWYYTDDNRIALEGKGQCLDLTAGSLVNGNQVQTWQCTDYNQNQIWTL